MRRVLALAVIATVVACGGSSTSSNANSPNTTASQIAFVVPPTTCTSGGLNTSLAGVLASSSDRAIANACTALADMCTRYKNMTSMTVGVINYNAAGTASVVAPGTYTVGAPAGSTGTIATVIADATDANCTSTSHSAVSGTVKVTSVTPQVTGTFDVVMDDNSHRTGSFSAAPCSNALPVNDICSASATAACASTTCL